MHTKKKVYGFYIGITSTIVKLLQNWNLNWYYKNGGKRREECRNTDTDIMIKPVSYIRLPQEEKYIIFFLHVPFLEYRWWRNFYRDKIIYHNNTEVDIQTED